MKNEPSLVAEGVRHVRVLPHTGDVERRLALHEAGGRVAVGDLARVRAGEPARVEVGPGLVRT